jgi:hypothetical protein
MDFEAEESLLQGMGRKMNALIDYTQSANVS